MNAQSLLVAAMLMAIATAFADTAAKAPTIAKELQQAKTYTISSPPTAPLFTDGGVLVGASSRSNGEPLRRPLVTFSSSTVYRAPSPLLPTSTTRGPRLGDVPGWPYLASKKIGHRLHFPPAFLFWRFAVRKSCCSVVSRTLVERCG